MSAKLSALATKTPEVALTDLMYLVRPSDGINGSTKATITDLKALIVDPHSTNTSNPHSVTAAQAGADVAGAAASVQGNLDTHISDAANPHSVTAAQAGADPVGSAASVQSNLDSHTSDTGNPHSVTAAQAGADPVGSADAVQSNLDSHTSDTGNPHSVTAAQAGADPVGSADAVQSNLDAFISAFTNVALVDGVATTIFTFDVTVFSAIEMIVYIENTVSGSVETVKVVVFNEGATPVIVTYDGDAEADAGHVFSADKVGNDISVKIQANGTDWQARGTVVKVAA